MNGTTVARARHFFKTFHEFQTSLGPWPRFVRFATHGQRRADATRTTVAHRREWATDSTRASFSPRRHSARRSTVSGIALPQKNEADTGRPAPCATMNGVKFTQIEMVDADAALSGSDGVRWATPRGRSARALFLRGYARRRPQAGLVLR